MTIHEAQEQLSFQLSAVYEEREAANITDWVMENVTGCKKIDRIMNKQVDLSPEKIESLQKIIKELQDQKPIQYVLHEAWFHGMKFYVDENVLIPRPETEELVEWIAREVGSQESGDGRLIVLDVGTGSGCMSIALKKELPKAEVWGCDISELALNVARYNSANLDQVVDFLGLDFLDPNERNSQLPRVDMLVSNPPYVPEKDKYEMEARVVNYEPHLALFVSNSDPLLFYRAIADFANEKLKEKGCIYIEIHENLGNDVASLFRASGFNKVEIRKDMQGKDRMLRVRKAF